MLIIDIISLLSSLLSSLLQPLTALSWIESSHDAVNDLLIEFFDDWVLHDRSVLLCFRITRGLEQLSQRPDVAGGRFIDELLKRCFELRHRFPVAVFVDHDLLA